MIKNTFKISSVKFKHTSPKSYLKICKYRADRLQRFQISLTKSGRKCKIVYTSFVFSFLTSVITIAFVQ